MRRFTIFAIFIFCVLAVMIFAWARQSNAPDLLTSVRADHPFSADEMRWHSLTRTLSSDGLVFYRPEFPNLSVRAQAERLTLTATPTTVSYRFTNGTLDAAKSIMKSGPNSALAGIKSFHEPVDFLLHPLTALTLLNHDVLRGNMEITIKYQSGNRAALTMRLWDNRGDILHLRTTLSNVKNANLWGWLNASFQTVQAQISDPQLLKSVSGYLTATGQPVPQALTDALTRHTPFQTGVHLTAPYPILSLFN